MAKPGLWKVREAAPSKGEKRFRLHRGHRPRNGLPRETTAEKVIRMITALRASKWKIQFNVEMLSPREFRYSADGESADEAFLKAFGIWGKDLRASISKTTRPIVVKKAPVIGRRLYMRTYRTGGRQKLAVAV